MSCINNNPLPSTTQDVSDFINKDESLLQQLVSSEGGNKEFHAVDEDNLITTSALSTTMMDLMKESTSPHGENSASTNHLVVDTFTNTVNDGNTLLSKRLLSGSSGEISGGSTVGTSNTKKETIKTTSISTTTNDGGSITTTTPLSYGGSRRIVVGGEKSSTTTVLSSNNSQGMNSSTISCHDDDDNDDGDSSTTTSDCNDHDNIGQQEQHRQKMKGGSKSYAGGSTSIGGESLSKESNIYESGFSTATPTSDCGGTSTDHHHHQQQQQEHHHPNTSTHPHLSSPSQFDDSNMQQQQHHQQHLLDPSAVLNFVMEQRIFLKAALNLISELDRTAPQLGMMDPIVLKAGSIKKASHLMNGVWKVKYVEIRRGMFSYYENAVSNTGNSRTDRNISASDYLHHNANNELHGYGSSNGGELLRKNIPLEASTCTCRAVKLHQKALNFSPSGAIFELTTTVLKASNNNNNKVTNSNSGMLPINSSITNSNNNNNTTTIRRLWLTTSRAERQAWMTAINNAMVGGSVTRGDTTMDHHGTIRPVTNSIRSSPFRNDIRKYMKQQSILRSAKSSTEYLLGIRELLNHSLHIPVEWIRKQTATNQNDNFTNTNNNNNVSLSAFHESTVELSVDQLRRDLQRDSLSINGIVYRGDNHHGPEQIFSALTRCIFNVARGSSGTGTTSPQHQSFSSMSDLRESKALAYARDILLAGNRTRSGGDSYFCVETLCSNTDLVVLVPAGTEVQPVEITVTEDETLQNRFNDKSDWIRTRSKLQRSWRRQYVVLSEGMLSYYEGASPRPHGLRGQQVLKDMIISVSKKKSDANSGNNTSSILMDNTHDEYIVSISLKEGPKDRLLLFDSETKLLDWIYALECVTKAKPLPDVPRKTIRRRSTKAEQEGVGNSTIASILTSAQQATLDHALKVGLDSVLVERRLKNLDHRAACSVKVSVSALTEYKVCTTNPQGDDDQDTWATIQAHFLQAFRISGGPAGRIMRGEEVVRFSVLNCLDPSNTQQPTLDGAVSPSTMRSRINRRIFRNNSTDHDLTMDVGPPSGAFE